MKLFQNQLSFVIKNILRPCVLFKEATCVCTFSAESMVYSLWFNHIVDRIHNLSHPI